MLNRLYCVGDWHGCNFSGQANVSHCAMQFPQPATGSKVLGPTWYCAMWQQKVPIRLPPIIMAGSRQGRSTTAPQTLHPSRLALYWRPTEKTGRLLRKSQVDQQWNGQKWTGTFMGTFLSYLHPHSLGWVNFSKHFQHWRKIDSAYTQCLKIKENIAFDFF